MKSDINKDLIMIPYANDLKKNTGENIKNKKNRLDVYLKNCCVASISAKRQNPECDVAIVTNIDIEGTYKALLERNEILIIYVPFNDFCFDGDYKWSLAFYKLCALFNVLNDRVYRNYIYMDCDIYVQSSFKNIWKECENSILLYDINHGFGIADYERIVSEFSEFKGKDCCVTHYGGEFFAANRENALKFINECHEIYLNMIDANFVTTKGDEFIISLAAKAFCDKVKNASAYIYRFWTSSFYLISTCFKYNPVSILHLPNEKEKGLLKIYSKYISKQKDITNKKVWSICRLKDSRPLIVKLQCLVKKLLRK